LCQSFVEKKYTLFIMAKAAFVESLEQDFVVEEIQVSSDEDEEQIEQVPAPDNDVEKVPKLKGKKAKEPKLNDRIGNSKRKKLTFEDLGMEIQELPDLHQNTFTVLMDKLYDSAPKPLFVKSHTKVKVLIVSSSALRCLEIIRELKTTMPNVRVAKLFARHMKVNEQIEVIIILILVFKRIAISSRSWNTSAINQDFRN
jgi:hypothetical protein